MFLRSFIKKQDQGGKLKFMIKELFVETYKYMWRNKKNRLFMALSFAVVIIYSLFLVPNAQDPTEINVSSLERDMYGSQQQFEDRLDSGQTALSLFTGTSVYYESRNEYAQRRELLTAIKQGDIYRYLENSYRPDQGEELASGDFDFEILGRETEFSMPVRQAKTSYYANEVEDLSFHTVFEKTSLQQLHLFLVGLGPIVLLLSLIFLISDVLVKDRQLETQKIGVPLRWPLYLFVQSIAALSFVLIFFMAVTGVFVLLNGILHGFGTFDLPIGGYTVLVDEFERAYVDLSMGEMGSFLLTITPFLLLLLYLFTRLNTLFSLLFKQPVVVMAVGIFTVVFQNLYYTEGTPDLLGIHLSRFPQTYFNIGQIITGRFEAMTLEAVPEILTRGFIVLGFTIVILELILYVTSKKITRQSFIR